VTFRLRERSFLTNMLAIDNRV